MKIALILSALSLVGTCSAGCAVTSSGAAKAGVRLGVDVSPSGGGVYAEAYNRQESDEPARVEIESPPLNRVLDAVLPE